MTSSIDSAALSRLGLLQQAPSNAPDKLGQEDFLRLMITQLRNQDPFSPMESSDFLGQLAQFGTVSGIEDVRGAVESLSGAVSSNQALQAAGLVDRSVLVPSREAWLPPDGSIEASIDVPPGVADVAVGVYDLGGRLVATPSVASDASGLHSISWDGSLDDGSRAPTGYYELRASANVGTESLALDTLVKGRVESVSVNAGNVSLTVTGLGIVNFADVRGIG